MAKKKPRNQATSRAQAEPASRPAIMFRPPAEQLRRLRLAIGARSADRIQPHTAQGIIVEAVEAWLKKNAY